MTYKEPTYESENSMDELNNSDYDIDESYEEYGEETCEDCGYVYGECDCSITKDEFVYREYDDHVPEHRSPNIPKPINLTSLRCNCYRCVWKGDIKECSQKYVTFDEMKIYMFEENEKKIKEQLDKIIENFESERREREKHNEKMCMIISSLKEISRVKGSDEEKPKKPKKRVFKPLSMSSRKGGIRYRKTTSEETIKARRSLARSQRKLRKKQEDMERVSYFKNISVPKDDKIINNDGSFDNDNMSELETDTTDNDDTLFDRKQYKYDSNSSETSSIINMFTPNNTPINTPINTHKESMTETDWTIVKKNSQPCISVKNNIPCKYGDNCKYSHAIDCISETKNKRRKTIICKSVINGTVCRYGSRCNFAHNIHELVVEPCFYGHRCRNIVIRSTYDGKIYKNIPNKLCLHIHPLENLYDYYDRCNIPYNKVTNNTHTLSYCTKKCCVFTKCRQNIHTSFETKKGKKKAGIFVHDPDNKRILIIQSRNNLWGVPKGTLEPNEEYIDCALRELKEETSIQLNSSDLLRMKRIRNNSVYYYVNINYTRVKINVDDIEDDVTGICWIRIDCLLNMVNNNHIKITTSFDTLFKKFIGINLLQNKLQV